MIKFIKKWVCKILNIKKCECPEQEEVGQKGFPIINEVNRKMEKILRKHKGDSK